MIKLPKTTAEITQSSNGEIKIKIDENFYNNYKNVISSFRYYHTDGSDGTVYNYSQSTTNEITSNHTLTNLTQKYYLAVVLADDDNTVQKISDDYTFTLNPMKASVVAAKATWNDLLISVNGNNIDKTTGNIGGIYSSNILYKIENNGEIKQTGTTFDDTTLYKSNILNGTYDIFITAKSRYSTSLFTAEANTSITFNKLDAVSDLTSEAIGYNSLKFSWSKNPNSNQSKYIFKNSTDTIYVGIINNGENDEITFTDLDLYLDQEGEYTFEIEPQYKYDNGEIYRGEVSSITARIGSVGTPLMGLTQSDINQIRVEWTYLSDINQSSQTPYIKMDDGEYEIGSGIMKLYNNLDIGVHSFSLYIRVVSGSSYIDSDIVTQTLEIIKLPAPVITLNSKGDGFTWSYSSDYYQQGFRLYKNSVLDRMLLPKTRSYKLDEQLTPGTYIYYIQAYYVLLNGIQAQNYFDSDNSGSLVITVYDLMKSNISFSDNSSILNISKVDNADYYEIYVNNVKVTETTDLVWNGLRDYIGENIGLYKVYVKAKSNSYAYNESTSNIIEYKIDKLTDPVITFSSDNSRITWPASTSQYIQDSDLINYDIYVDNDYFQTTNLLYFDIPSIMINSSIKIMAHITQGDNPNPYHISSDFSNEISIGKFPKPTNLRMDGTNLVWDFNYVIAAPSYDIYNYGVKISSTNINSWTVQTSEPNNYLLSIKVPEYNYTLESDMSDTLEVHITKLSSPSLVVTREPYYDENNKEYYKYIVNFGAINGADYYKLYINAKEENSNIHDGDYIILPVGSSEIRVKAFSNNVLIIPSEFSNIDRKYVNTDYQYYVLINNKIEREIELPFTINETADESLANGSVSLQLNDDSEPYETNTDISIRIVGNTPGINDNYVEIKKYNMLIAGDNVEEVYINKNIKYRHNISLIEQTKLLEYEIMPDISFTQPQAVSNINYLVTPNYNNYQVLTNDNYISNITGYTLFLTISGDPMWFVSSRNVFKTNLSLSNEKLRSHYTQTEIIELPYFNNAHIEFTSFHIEFHGLYGLIQKEISEGTTDSTLYFKYYIRKHSLNYEEDINCPEYEIATYNRNINKPTFKFVNIADEIGSSDNGYDIIMTMDSTNYDIYSTKDNTYNVKKLGKITCLSDGSFEPSDSYHYKPFRIVWNGTGSSSIMFNNNEVTYDNSITMVDALNKVIDTIEPLKWDNNRKESTKYALEIPAEINKDLLCPEVSYNNGKSLYEILQDLGREFLGIPYLDYSSESYRTIKFRIMRNDISKLINDNGNYLTSSSSDVENNVSGFVSNVSNIITDLDHSIWYPSKYSYVTPRAVDNSASITVQNCGIILDKPIYKIKKVLLTFKQSNGYYVNDFDITSFVYEQTIFNTLNNSINGKGRALYYSKGDNKIYGLGILPELTELQSALNLSQDKYVITNILKVSGFNVLTDDVKEMKFRIEYIPYTDTQLKLTQFNISDQNNFSYKAYNQTENLVQDEKFGSSLSKQIERLGNVDIKRTYITKTLFKITDEDDTGLTELFDARKFNEDCYFADNITTTFDSQYFKVSVNYTKNFNKINDRIGVNSEYRQYEIPLSANSNRVLNFNEYCYIDTKEYSIDKKNDITKDGLNDSWPVIIESMLAANPIDPPTQFFSAFKDLTNKDLQYKGYKNESSNSLESIDINYGMLCPATKLNIKNAVLFNGKLYDNFSAGNYADKNVSTDVGFYATKDVRYVDTYGRSPILRISLCDPISYNAYDYPKYGNSNNNLNSLNNTIFSGQYYINKDSSEALSYNYQMNFNTLNKNIDIHSGLTRYLFNDLGIDIPKPVLYYYKGNIKNIDCLNSSNIIGIGTEIQLEDIKTTINGTKYIDSIYPSFDISILQNIHPDGYAIVWPHSYNGKDNEIIFYTEVKDWHKVFATDPIYFNFLTKPILNNNLIKSGQ